MLSTFLFTVGTVLLSLNFIRLFGLAISDWFYFGALAAALIETTRFDKKNFGCWVHNRFIWMASLILFGAIISTARSIFVSVAVVEIFQQIYVITLFTSLCWIILRRGKGEQIVSAFIWAGILSATIAVLDYATGSHLGPFLSGVPDVQLWGRYAGTMRHPNKFGYFLAITTTLSFARLRSVKTGGRPNLIKAAWTFLFSLQLFGVYLSGSLTAYLGTTIALCVYIFFSKPDIYRNQHSGLRAISIVIFIFCFAIFLNYSLPQKSLLRATLINRAIDRVEMTTAATRYAIFEQTFQDIFDSPFVGAGYDQNSTSGIENDFRELPGTVHNLFLQMWYVGGLFSFIGLLSIYISLGWMAVSTLRIGKKISVPPIFLGSAAAVLGVLLMDQFQPFIYQRETWLAFSLLSSFAWNKKYFLTRKSSN